MCGPLIFHKLQIAVGTGISDGVHPRLLLTNSIGNAEHNMRQRLGGTASPFPTHEYICSRRQTSHDELEQLFISYSSSTI